VLRKPVGKKKSMADHLREFFVAGDKVCITQYDYYKHIPKHIY